MFDLRTVKRAEVLPLFEQHHGYKSLGNLAVYFFAVTENNRPIAAFAWQPPPPRAASSVCPEEPQGVLALSRMVAVPKTERQLKHISKPLRAQMKNLIDRTRWPVLVTYSDESLGHNGFVYQCSGWEKTTRKRVAIHEDAQGRRASRYSAGKTGGRPDVRRIGYAFIQRWEHWICPKGQAAAWMSSHGWRRELIKRRWKSGNVGHRFVRVLPTEEAIEAWLGM